MDRFAQEVFSEVLLEEGIEMNKTNLEIAKECGFSYQLVGEKPELVGFIEALDVYTARICEAKEAELQRKNAELTRKLAAYQAVDMIMRLDCADDPIVQQTPEPSYAELTKLLAKAKSKALPETVLKKYCVEFYYWWHNSQGTNTQDGYDEWFEKFGKAMLAAAPQPETDIDQAQRFK